MIVDFHTHVFPQWLQDQRQDYLKRDATFGALFASQNARMATAEDLVHAMDVDGVDVSVVMGMGWTDQRLARKVNDYIIESVALYPERLVGFASVNPAWGDAAAREAERCADAGLRGIGELHPDSQGFELDDRDIMAPLAELAQERRMIVTTHTSEPVGHLYQGKGHTTPDVVWRFIQNFPDITIVCAHWGGGLPFYALMPEVAEGLSNAYFDTAASPFLYSEKVFAVVASLIGFDGILLGSDYPLLRSRGVLKQVQESTLFSAVQKAAIAGGTAARLLQL